MGKIKDNSSAMGIPEASFGLFCVVVAIAGFIFLVSLMQSHNDPIVDTYGNTQSDITNDTQQVSMDVLQTGSSSIIWLVLIVAAVFLCMVVFAFWVASKAGLSI